MRPWLTLGLLCAVASAAPGVAPTATAQEKGARARKASPAPLDRLPDEAWTREAAAHLLRRAGFGGSPAEIDRLHALGLEGAVDHLVDYGATEVAFRDFRPTVTDRPDYRKMRGLPQEERQKIVQEHRRRDRMQFADLRTWWLERMAKTERPLEERMTLFWHGHFTSGYRDVRNSYHMYLQNELLRNHATGNFAELVHAIARDPAMLEYLDNRVNRKQHPNENFARELMELFTLGVGHYTERDIRNVARAFTGWTFAGNEYRFRPQWHDGGTKEVLGRKGTFDGDDVIDIILEQPAAAEHVARKVFVHFAHAEPPDAVVKGLARTLRRSGYEMRPLLKRLFRSREFYSERSVGGQIKSPVVLVISLMRAAEVEPDAFSMVLSNYVTGQLGMELMQPPNVKGWPGGESWITTSTLLQRYNIASQVLETPQGMKRNLRRVRAQIQKQLERGDGGMMAESERERRLKRLESVDEMIFDPLAATEGLESPEAIVDALLDRFLAVEPPEELRRSLVELLGEAPRDRDRLHRIVQLIVSTPEFQLS